MKFTESHLKHSINLSHVFLGKKRHLVCAQMMLRGRGGGGEGGGGGGGGGKGRGGRGGRGDGNRTEGWIYYITYLFN